MELFEHLDEPAHVRAANVSGQRCDEFDLGDCSLTTAVTLEYTCAAIGALDAYSAYLTSDQLTDVYSHGVCWQWRFWSGC